VDGLAGAGIPRIAFGDALLRTLDAFEGLGELFLWKGSPGHREGGYPTSRAARRPDTMVTCG
jgi:hypothetical protein